MRYFLLILMLCFSTRSGFAKTPAKNEIKKGNQLYNKGEFVEALKNYEQAYLNLPDSDIVNFNLGAGLYKTEHYRSAINHFEKTLISDNASLEQKASYNVGNAKYKYGIGHEDTDLPKAINLLKESLRHYEQALTLDPEDEDAKYNYEFVKKELERLEEKLKQEKQKKQQKKQRKQQAEKEKQEKQQEKEKEQEQEEQDEQQEKEEAEKQAEQPDSAKEEKEEAEQESPEQYPFCAKDTEKKLLPAKIAEPKRL